MSMSSIPEAVLRTAAQLAQGRQPRRGSLIVLVEYQRCSALFPSEYNLRLCFFTRVVLETLVAKADGFGPSDDEPRTRVDWFDLLVR